MFDIRFVNVSLFSSNIIPISFTINQFLRHSCVHMKYDIEIWAGNSKYPKF